MWVLVMFAIMAALFVVSMLLIPRPHVDPAPGLHVVTKIQRSQEFQNRKKRNFKKTPPGIFSRGK